MSHRNEAAKYKQNEPAKHDEVFLSANQVRRRYGGASHMFIERRLHDDADFPRPVKLGRLRYWKLSELERWERLRVVAGSQ